MLKLLQLFPWLTVQKNVEFGLEIQGVAAAERRERAALARTLVVDPSVLLLDEPFSALDAQTKMILQRDLAETLSESGKTALFITHDLVEAVALSDRVLVMSQRPGRIIEDITMEMPDRKDPMARRRNDALGGYVARLMTLLDIGHAGVAV